MYLPINLPIYLSTYLSIYLSIYLRRSTYNIYMYIYIYTSICFNTTPERCPLSIPGPLPRAQAVIAAVYDTWHEEALQCLHHYSKSYYTKLNATPEILFLYQSPSSKSRCVKFMKGCANTAYFNPQLSGYPPAPRPHPGS